jgi:hypothetical protein
MAAPGNDTYNFGSTFGQDAINNGSTSGAKGQINFAAATENFWFAQSGNNLVIDLLGTNSSVTVNNWFAGSSNAQVLSVNAGDETLLNSKVAALVSAMASYSDANSGFNPTTATPMPTDTTLQAAITANWQHA